jgi:xylulokinase
MGERGPRPDPLARGALVGLTLRHGRAHVVRAVLEGTAFHLRRLLEARTGARPDDRAAGDQIGRGWPPGAVACGGAARSPLWQQILADVTRLPLRCPEVVEVGALGAAILGGAAAGILEWETAPARLVRTARVYRPDGAAAQTYEVLYDRYCALDDLLAPWFRGETPGDAPGAGDAPG